jgi:hypothetical protein
MPLDPIKTVIESLGHASRQERRKGNYSRANGLALIAFGIFLLPIPVIGVPMMIAGLVKLFS